MRIPIPESLPKVFVLSTPMHLLAKLHWEIKGFQRSLTNKDIHRNLLPAYHGFNCAVTAWHLTDWTWEYVGEEGHAELARIFKLDEPSVDLRSFQDAAARASRALNACREIANGSKHRDVKRKRADPYVRAGSRWAELKRARGGAPRYGTAWFISDQHGTRPALEVFKEAAGYWRHILSPWMEDTFIQGRRGAR
jgi:hypothetical protein